MRALETNRMKSRRQNRGDIFLVGLIAIAAGVFNLVIERFIDGTLCIIVGTSVLLFWKMKYRK